MKLEGKVLITGGTGTIGQAILRRAHDELWDCDFSVFSRSWKNQSDLKRAYPKVNMILGDVLDPVGISMAIAGHDIVIHAAAMKHIVRGEENPLLAYEVNVNGSINVLQACTQHNVKHVIGISTDKACSPINAYGASKMMMEKAFQQYAETYDNTQFHLVRYGNVIGSAGSFIHSWRIQQEMGEPVWSTDPEMTRFWLTEDDGVDLILGSITDKSGLIRVPSALSARIGDIEEWVLGKPADRYIGSRPGEKIHETLITSEETTRYFCNDMIFRIYPSTTLEERFLPREPLSSDTANKLTKEEFLTMLGEM